MCCASRRFSIAPLLQTVSIRGQDPLSFILDARTHAHRKSRSAPMKMEVALTPRYSASSPTALSISLSFVPSPRLPASPFPPYRAHRSGSPTRYRGTILPTGKTGTFCIWVGIAICLRGEKHWRSDENARGNYVGRSHPRSPSSGIRLLFRSR